MEKGDIIDMIMDDIADNINHWHEFMLSITRQYLERQSKAQLIEEFQIEE